MASHAFEFLDEPFASAFEAPAPVNVFTVAGLARHAGVASDVLAFLLDPNERHGFGTAFVDALVRLLDGAATADGHAFQAQLGSSEWSVATATSARDDARIDILLENDELDVAIVVEHTGWAGVAREVRPDHAHASRSHGTVVTAALAPRRRDLLATALPHVRALTYDDLFDAAGAALYDVGPMADPRSLELYAQFRETTSERIATMTIEQEQRRLDELWSAIGERQDQVLDFFTAVDAVNAVLVARGTRLQRAVGERLDALGIEHSSRTVNAGDHAWGRSRGERALVHTGFHLGERGHLELLIGWLPRTGTFGYAVQAYERQGRPPRPWDHIPLGLPFDADEDAVADRVAELAQRWIAGERPT